MPCTLFIPPKYKLDAFPIAAILERRRAGEKLYHLQSANAVGMMRSIGQCDECVPAEVRGILEETQTNLYEKNEDEAA